MIEAQEEKAMFAELDESLRRGTLDAESLKQALAPYMDISFPTIPVEENAGKLTALYCEGMVDKHQLNEYLVVACQFASQAALPNKEGSIPLHELPLMNNVDTFEDMMSGLFNGCLILYLEGNSYFLLFHIAKVPQRQLQESNTEISIKGPKDAFTEELYINISIIRKRLQTSLLYCEQFQIGSLSKTKIAFLYLQHKANQATITEVRNRLDTFDTESIVSSGQLEQWITDRTFSLVPLIDYIGRPDFVVESLLRGKFIIIVDGSPMVLIGPSNFLTLLKSPEDVHFPYYYVMIQRLLRLMGMMLSIFLPGFWIALSAVNLDQLPFSLVSTVVISREGVPLPMFLESLLLLFLFELLREAGVRLPKAVGQTIGIVGGLIIGDSLIRAGLSSPTLLVVIAISAVATFSLVNQSLSGSVSLFRLIIFVVSAYLGIYGFFLSMFLIFIYFCRLSSFGLAYLEPIVSLHFKEWLSAFMMNPFKRKDFTSTMITKKKDGS